MEKAKKILQYTLYTLYIAGALPVIKSHTPDNDLYFLIATGREILNNGIPYLNPFHHLPDLEIIVQQWFGCVLNYIVYTKFQTLGLYIITVIYTILHLQALCMVLKLFTKSRKAIAMLLPLEFIVMYPFFNLRGSILTSCILLWEVYILTQYTRKESNKYISILPLLSIILINWQMAAWPLMFVLIVPFFLPGRAGNITAYYKEKKILLTRLAIFTSISVAAGLINPYGIKGMLYLPKSLGIISGYVAEFSNIEATSIYALISLVYFTLLIIYITTKKEKADLRYIGLATIGFFLSITIKRNTWYNVFMLPIAVQVIAAGLKTDNAKVIWELLFPQKKITYILKIISIWFISVGCMIAAYHIAYSPAYETNDNLFVPTSAIKYLTSRQGQKKVMTEFNNGGFFLWHHFKIYMEARPELYQKNINRQENIYQEYISSRTDPQKLDEVINKYQFTHVITEKHSVTYQFMKQRKDFKPVLSDDLNYQLFEYSK